MITYGAMPVASSGSGTSNVYRTVDGSANCGQSDLLRETTAAVEANFQAFAFKA